MQKLTQNKASLWFIETVSIFLFGTASEFFEEFFCQQQYMKRCWLPTSDISKQCSHAGGSFYIAC
jgi:hypothetical protein